MNSFSHSYCTFLKLVITSLIEVVHVYTHTCAHTQKVVSMKVKPPIFEQAGFFPLLLSPSVRMEVNPEESTQVCFVPLTPVSWTTGWGRHRMHQLQNTNSCNGAN